MTFDHILNWKLKHGSHKFPGPDGGTCREEEWRAVRGWPYEVSSEGRIRNGKGRLIKPTQQRGKMQYLVVSLYCGGRLSQRQFYVHLLVCEAFNGERPLGSVARHLDGNVLNCRSDNLSWGTPLENQQDRQRHGTHNHGSRNGRAVLDEEAVIAIREVYADLRRNGQHTPKGMVKALAGKFGVKRDAIARSGNGKSWRHL